MSRLIALLVCLLACPAAAEVLLAARTIPARTVLTELDLMMGAGEVAGAATRPEEAVGLETRMPIYAGRPVVLATLGPAALIERNNPVLLRYISGRLVIETEGRALDRAAAGEVVRVMNLSSRLTVTGRAIAPGIVEVGR